MVISGILAGSAGVKRGAGNSFSAFKNSKTAVLQPAAPLVKTGISAPALSGAFQGYNGIKIAGTASFGQNSLIEAFEELSRKMYSCGKEDAGTNVPITDLINRYAPMLPQEEDAVKTNIEVDADDKNGTFIEARTQLKKMKDGILYEAAVRQPRPRGTKADKTKPLIQKITIIQDPQMSEKAYLVKTKGKLIAAAEDGGSVLLTNAGTFKKKNTAGGIFNVSVEMPENKFHPFIAAPQEVKERVFEPSEGKGTDIVIGMEAGRFVPQIIDSIESFCRKINNGEIVLDKFKAAPDAQNIQLAMLAGGFGSRAEYTNASSDRIFHGDPNGAETTKGVFRTATGFTPMETTFITLHNAGLLDCSKGNIGIGKNIKLYLNESGVNKGNGGFTLDLYNKMERSKRKCLAVFPNDSMSRMTEAVRKMHALMNSGGTALAMIAKEISAEDAKGNFGIMKLGKNNEILEFAEKPKVIPEGYEKSGKCLTNTFQFAVSKEAFKALSILEPYIPAEKGKEPRDWSKTYIPILMTLTQKKNIQKIMEDIENITGADRNKMPYEAVNKAKQAVNGMKIIAIPTDEPWADCGTLNQLYHTTMQIASGTFPLEDFERKHVLDCINTETGLIASSSGQKKAIEDKYFIEGQVMAVPKVKKVNPEIVSKYKAKGAITVNPHRY